MTELVKKKNNIMEAHFTCLILLWFFEKKRNPMNKINQKKGERIKRSAFDKIKNMSQN